MNLLFLGDSLTEWFDWQERFPAHHVLNMGIAGETADGLLSRLVRVTGTAGRRDFVFLMTGINNIAIEDYEIISTYRQIVERLVKGFGKSAVVIQSILPTFLPWVSAGTIIDQNSSLQSIAQDCGTHYLDLYRIFTDASGRPIREFLLDDGVHLSGRGYRAWADAVEQFLISKQ